MNTGQLESLYKEVRNNTTKYYNYLNKFIFDPPVSYTIEGGTVIPYKFVNQHDTHDFYREYLYNVFFSDLKTILDNTGISRELLGTGSGGWVYKITMTDKDRKSFSDYFHKHMIRQIPNDKKCILPQEFAMKIHIITKYKVRNIGKNNKTEEKQAIKENAFSQFLASSPLSKKYVPKYYFGGTYKWNKKMNDTMYTFIFRITFSEVVRGKPLLRLILDRTPLPRSVIPTLEKACMSLWRQNILHGDFHDGNIIVDVNGKVLKSLKIIDFGEAKKYSDNENASNDKWNVKKLRDHIEKIEKLVITNT